MATVGVPAERPLFVRQATGLVRGWSIADAGIYCFWAISLFSIGIYTFSLATFIPGGSLVWAAVISSAFLTFEIIVYAAMISLMPRAGGDYVWQTRVIHGGIGFVVAAAGWWFAMWHFVPIYGSFLVQQVLNPLLGIVGAPGIASWLATNDGIFAASMCIVVICTGWVMLGLGGYAKLQKYCLWLGGLGFVILCGLLLFSSKSDFISAFNREADAQFGAGPDAYQTTLEVAGYDTVGLGFPLKATFLLIAMVLFWNIWVVWGATLAGEVRGAREFRRNLLAMGGALFGCLALALLFFALVAKTMGWDFYNAANNAYWGGIYGYVENPPLATFPSPFMLGSWLVDNAFFQFVLISLGTLWFFALMGTLFLSSTRVIFAAAFDRVLPEAAAAVTQRYRVPWVALLLMMAPGIVVSLLYAYWSNFATYTLDTLLLITVTYLGTGIAAMLVPWRARRIYRASPLARWEYKGIPLLSAAAFIFSSFLTANIVLWLKDDVYGVNNKQSLIYLGVLYGLAIAIYITARIVRGRQGMPLDRVHAEIPAE